MEVWTVQQFRDYAAKATVTIGKPKKVVQSFANACLIVELRVYLESVWPDLTQEFTFHPVRKWRFDYCSPSLMLACEIEGIGSAWKGKSRHTTVEGYQGDLDKYNAATALGFTVFRYSYDDLRKLKYKLYIY